MCWTCFPFLILFTDCSYCFNYNDIDYYIDECMINIFLYIK